MTDKTSPHSQEAEESVLGAALIDPVVITRIAERLKPDHFFLLRHRHLYAAMMALASRREPVDFVTVQAELEARGQLEDAGGPAYLLNLVNNTPTSRNAEFYAEIVRRAAMRRKVIVVAEEMKALAVNEGLSLEGVTGQLQTLVMGLLTYGIDRRFEHSMSDLAGEVLDDIERYMEHPDSVPTITTGFRDFDGVLGGGFWPQDLIMLAGRPGMGKTAFMLNLAGNAAKAGHRVGITSLEMDAKSLFRRMAASATGINLTKLRTGNLAPAEWAALLPVADKLSRLPIVTNDRSAQSVSEVRACLQRWKVEQGIEVAFVDYLGLLHPEDKRLSKKQADNRTREIDEMMVAMKETARDLEIAIMLAAQVNRMVENRADKRPSLADLRESGGIEANADIVAFLYREVVYNEATENPNKAEVIVAKHRNGPTDTIVLHYDRTTTLFSNGRPVRIDLTALTGGSPIDRTMPPEGE